MKLHLYFAVLLLSCLYSLKAYAQPCDLSGTYSIGPGGNFTSLTQALDSLRSRGVGGPVILEFKSAYASNVETYPLAFANIPCISAANNITVRPEAGSPMIQLSGSTNVPVINLSNSRYIHFDGRAGGTGNTIGMSIQNANGAFTFSNDASFNTLSYLDIKSGSVSFLGSTNTITNGNSNNTISNCTIGGTGAYCIYSSGTSGKKNTNNKVLNCVLYDYFSGTAASTAGAVFLDANNDKWEITGNSIFNTIVFTTYSTSPSYGIYINDPASSGFTIHNNYIGGTAPLCGGVPLVYLGPWTGISVNTGSASLTSVKNNTVGNINWFNEDGSEAISGIRLLGGRINCNGNTIGSETQSGNIKTTSGYLQNAHAYGIAVVPSPLTQTIQDSFIIQNNKVAGFRIQLGPTNFFESYFNGIYATGISKSYLDISSNSIGSSMLNSIESVVREDELKGINVEITDSTGSINNPNPLTCYIRNNRCNNFYGMTEGIRVYNGAPQVTGNVITNLYNAQSLNISIIGISIYSSQPGTLVENNEVNGLRAVNGESGTPELTGIWASRVSNIKIAKNFVHSSTATGRAILQGIIVGSNANVRPGDAVDIQNNMISLGNDSIPASHDYTITGIFAPLYNVAVHHNSVNITGVGGVVSARTIALRLVGAVSNNNNKVVNNIFQNNRTSSSANNIVFDDTLQTTSQLLLNNNIYYTDQPGNSIALFKGIAYKTISAWRAASKQDSNSIFAKPNFVNAAGWQQAVDLHLANPTPAEGQGLAEAAITDDFDGQSINNFSPVDIGADAGNFVFKDGDAPVITPDAYSLYLLNAADSYKIKITDNGNGVDTNGINKPRMWFRKSYPSAGSWYSVAGNLVSGQVKSGEWNFSPDFSVLNLSAGDSIAYYFVAQDKEQFFNVAYSHPDSVLHTSVNNQVAPPIKPSRLFVYGYLPDTVYVGSGQTYTSLTSDGGFFQAFQKLQFRPGIPAGHVIITSDLVEMAQHKFNMFAGPGAPVKIYTNTPVLKLVKVTNIYSAHMIELVDNYNVTIDGSVNGSGRYLQFTTQHVSLQSSSLATLMVSGITKDLSVKNCIFSSNNTNTVRYATVYINGKNQHNISIEGNLFRDIPGVNQLPVCLLRIIEADTLTVSNNEFLNFNGNAIMFLAVTDIVAPSINISGNHFYYDRTTALGVAAGSSAISVTSSVPVNITGNYIGGSDKFCGGVPWRHRYENATIVGINYTGSYSSTGSIQNNTIRNFRLTFASTTSNKFTGIKLTNGNFDVGTQVANVIGQTIDTSIYATIFIGIDAASGVGSQYKPTVRINNTTITGIGGSFINGISLAGRKAEIKNNTINNCFAGRDGYVGIRTSFDSGAVANNSVYSINSRNPYIPPNTTSSTGIEVGAPTTVTATDEIIVSSNKVYNLKMPGNQVLSGIVMGGWGPFHIVNNQVNLSNDSATNTVSLRGLSISTGNTSYQNKVHYNTIRIFGNAAGNTNNSYAAYIGGGSAIASFRNNFLYNQRAGGTGKNLALGMLSTSTNPVTWPALNASNNLYVTNDTINVNEWKASGAVSLSQWQSLSQGDNNSYNRTVQKVLADSIFVSAANGDLNINNQSSVCWYLNEKGKPIASVSGDFNTLSGARSIDTINGKTDIGSDEFITTAIPPATGFTSCINGDASVSSSITGNSYQWQLKTGSSFINITDNASYTGTNTATLQITDVPVSWYGYRYRCLVDGNYSDEYSLEFINQWTGAVNTAWENAGNWSCGVVPDINTDVKISSGNVILSTNGYCRSISVSAGASFTIAAGFTLTIAH